MIIRISRSVCVWGAIVLGAALSASAATITVGKSGADYTTLQAALSAVSATYTTIRFIDSETYDESNQPSLSAAQYEGLTIESATGERATVNYTGAGGYGLYFDRPNMTFRNLNLKTDGRTAVLYPGGSATDALVTGVNFSTTVTGASHWLLGAAPNMTVSYCTFYGSGAGTDYCRGISVYMPAGTPITIDHCSFDNLGLSPIHNGSGGAMTVRNCAFGNHRNSPTYRKAIYVADTLYEDYNAWYLRDTIAWPEGGTDWSGITNGGHSVKLAAYGDIFTGTTSNGDWSVGCALHIGGENGTTIGAQAWTPNVLTVGSGGMYADLASALAAPPDCGDLIQFIDSATYDMTSEAPALNIDRLTIASAEGERATLDFTAAGPSYYGLKMDADLLTVSNLNITTSVRTTLIQAAGGTNASFRNVSFVNTGGGTGIETLDGTSFEYCTFHSASADWGGGFGISWSYGNAITVNHCSFNNCESGIKNPDGDASTTLVVSNSAFGQWTDSRWIGGFTIGGVACTATEDYNASYGPRPFIRGVDDGNDVAKTTSGGHSIHYGYPGSITDVFIGDTSAGNWKVPVALRTAASDGTAIGAWQPPPGIIGSVLLLQ